jgi:hypothetical protein
MNLIKDKLYWYGKHPRTTQLYDGRPAPNGKAYKMDVRRFIWPEDYTLDALVASEKIYDENPDVVAWKAQRWIVKHIRYVDDVKIGRTEFWLFPPETLTMGTGDCEDGSILMASLMLNALPYEHQWRVAVNARWVDTGSGAEQGGHAHCRYIRTTDNMPVILDWCYLEDSEAPVTAKPVESAVRQYRDVWFSFNHEWAWSHVASTMAGRVKGKGRECSP